MEYLGLYNDEGIYTNESIERSKKTEVPKGRYFRVIIVFIENSNGEFLIQKVSKEKGGIYATTGGHVKDGSTSLETVKEEIFEELGISINNGIELFKTYKYDKAYQDCYYVKKDIDINKINLQLEEVESVSWLSVEEINKLIEENKFRKNNIESLRELIKKQGSNL